MPPAPEMLPAPDNAIVAAGSAAISQSYNASVVRQGTAITAINWQLFNIGASETTKFVQPATSAVALNRILGELQASRIYGSLKANGVVFLITPDGIVIGPSSSIDMSEPNVTASTDAVFSVSEAVAWGIVSDSDLSLITDTLSIWPSASGGGLNLGGNVAASTTGGIELHSDAGSVGNISLGGALTSSTTGALTSSATPSTGIATSVGTISISGTGGIATTASVFDATTHSSVFGTVDLGEVHAIRAYSWKSHTVLNSVSLQSGGDSTSLVPVRDVPAEETTTTGAAVDLNDAIAILKMVVGLGVNDASQPLSPYQAIAADFDGNGAVSLTDAIGVLKHVVGLETASPSWLFVNETDPTTPARASLNPGMLTATIDTNSTTNTSIGLVGILRGDVDGSWAAPTGSQTLDSVYFTDLVATLNNNAISTAQWGIYPA